MLEVQGPVNWVTSSVKLASGALPKERMQHRHRPHGGFSYSL